MGDKQAVRRFVCNVCHKAVSVTTRDRFRTHKDGDENCLGSGRIVPQMQLDQGPMTEAELKQPDKPVYGRDLASCATCDRKLVALTEDGKLKQHSSSRTEWSPCDNREPTIDTGLSAPDATSAPTTGSSSAEKSSGDTSSSSPITRFAQPCAPSSRFAQPCDTRTVESGSSIQMSEFSRDLLVSLKQVFFQYNQRQTSDNRSAQTTLGPSEIGSPCDRRIVMSLLGMPAVAPGGDGFAAWLGTQAHAGVAQMLEWASGRSGRYVVEVPLLFPSPYVPRGTSDALDRVLRVALDHKFMGTYSLRKLKTKGPSATYRKQVHTYAYGQQLRGEKVDWVAIVGWPRQEADLDDMYVWSEPYDPSVAIEALGRVHSLAESAEARRKDGATKMGTALSFPITKDCTYCPFYLPDGDNRFACNGKE